MIKATARIIIWMAIVMLLFPITEIYAWGPDRPTYTMEDFPNTAVFNSITDNPAVGDERDFVRVAQVLTEEEQAAGEEKGTYGNRIEVSPGHDYEVYVYFHNNANEAYNTEEHDYMAVARNTRFSTDFPSSLKAHEEGTIYGAFSSTTTDPEKVWDEAYVTATEDVTLHYVNGSAKIRNSWQADGSILSRNMFLAEGTFIGLNELEGTILGGDKYSGHIVYTIRVMAAGEFESATTDGEPEDQFADENDSKLNDTVSDKEAADEIIESNRVASGSESWFSKSDVPKYLIGAGVACIVVYMIMRKRSK